jgi:hypothetical protein
MLPVGCTVLVIVGLVIVGVVVRVVRVVGVVVRGWFGLVLWLYPLVFETGVSAYSRSRGWCCCPRRGAVPS